MNHDAISVQICLSSGMNETQADALLTRLSSLFSSLPEGLMLMPVDMLTDALDSLNAFTAGRHASQRDVDNADILAAYLFAKLEPQQGQGI